MKLSNFITADVEKMSEISRVRSGTARKRTTHRRTAVELGKHMIALIILDRYNSPRKANTLFRQQFIKDSGAKYARQQVFKTRAWAKDLNKWLDEQGLMIVAKPSE